MTDDEQQWLRCELITSKPDTDASIVTGLGATGVEVQDSTTYMEGADIPPVPERKARLIAFFDDDRPAAGLRRRLEEALDDVEIVSVAPYSDRSWETAWMDYFEPTELSDRVKVGPPWDPPQADDNELALIIEPGMAFGTGSHETTQLSAQLVDEAMARRNIDTVLDVGCGSAILSMVASGLGARRVVGIDVDARAVEAAEQNIAENPVDTSRIELSTTPLSAIDDVFDLVVANILSPVLLNLRDQLVDAVAPGGELILSGISGDAISGIREAFDHRDFTQTRCLSDGPWRALSFERTDN